MKPNGLPTSLFALLVWLSLGFITNVHAAPRPSCETSLAQLSWALDDGAQYHQLNSDRSGKDLHGVACREADIIAWFTANAWTHLKSVSPSGTHFGHGAQNYRADRSLVFCQPRSFLFRWRTNGCAAQASVSLFKGQITNLTAGPTK